MMGYDFSRYRFSDVARRLKIAGFCPLDVMVTGVTGAGKSTTLNAFFRNEVAKVGYGVEPETMEVDAYSLNGIFRLWDTPGLGDGVLKDRAHQKKIVELLRKSYCLDHQEYGFIDLVLVVLDGSCRDLGTTYHLLNEVIFPNIQRERVLLAINQADFAMKGHHWLSGIGQPDSVLMQYLDEQSRSVQRRIHEATGGEISRPVFYSAEYGFGLRGLFDQIVDRVPCCRRPMISA